MPRKILIVDDLTVNRMILNKMLHKEYDILEAANGEEALEILTLNHDAVSAVLLDISMPVMDGYELLSKIRSDAFLERVPVIMITGSDDEEARVKSLTLGANDFVMKPYSSEIIRHCLKNNIAFVEAAATVDALQRDRLTGVWNRETFFQKAALEIEKKPEGYYVLGCVDIDGFKIINDQYGNGIGDKVLKTLAAMLMESCETNGGICGRIFADRFISLYPHELADSGAIGPEILGRKMLESTGMNLTFSVGRYIVKDKDLSVNAMYDRATIARNTVKGRYDTHIAVYDESMRSRIVHEQRIVSEMNAALAEKQFEVWFQPQYNHSTEAMIGAEALVRWKHPQKGMIPPNEFIPIFEKNGFVYSLDRFVWEEVCRYLRKWLDEGRNPLPVSVNISRYDILRPDLMDVITGLIRKYEIPIDLLRIEITESIFAGSTQHIVNIVKKLIDFGFTVEIDDFGSGYSSLNTLKDVPAQIIKLDMKFLESSTDSQRGGNIVESVVRMAKWLGVSVIAEGVETPEQADYLGSIGCNYIQGFLYARPMNAQLYESHCRGAGREERLLALETVENLDNNAFWDPGSMDTLIFNSYVGGASIFEYYGGKIELLRATKKYARVMGNADMSVEDILRLDLTEHLDAENQALLAKVIEESARTRSEVTAQYLFLDLPGCPHETYFRSTMRVIAMAGERYLVYCTNDNVTEQRKAELHERRIAEQMQSVMDNVTSGITAATLDEEGVISLLFTNDKFFEIHGYTREQYETQVTDKYMCIHPEDREKAKLDTINAYRAQIPTSLEYRLIRPDGAVTWVRVGLSSTKFTGIEQNVHLCIFTDITAEKRAEQEIKDAAAQIQSMMSDMPGGLASLKVLPVAIQSMMEYSSEVSFIKGRDLRYISCSEQFARLLGLSSKDELIGRYSSAVFPPELAAQNDAVDRAVLKSGKSYVDYDIPFPAAEGMRHLMFSKYPLLDAGGNVLGIYGTGHDITETRKMQSQLEMLTNNIPGGIAIYEGDPDNFDKIRLVFCSEGLSRLFGYTHEEYMRLASENLTGLVFSEDVDTMHQNIRKLISDNIPMDYIYRSKNNDGATKWINVKAVMGEPNGRNLTVNAVFFDVTEQKEALEKLRISEEVNRLAIEQSKSVVCQYDVRTRVLSISPNVSPIFEASSTALDVPYQTIRDGKVSENTSDAYISFYESIMRGDKKGKVIYQRKSTAGWRWIESHFTTIFTDSGEPSIGVVSFEDVTESVEKDSAYKRWQQSLLSRSPESYTMFHCSIGREISYDSREGSLLTIRFEPGGFDFDSHTRQYVDGYVLPEYKKQFASFLNTESLFDSFYKGDRNKTLEYREALPDGGFRWMRLTVELVESADSAIIEAYLLFENIDEAKRTEIDILERAETDPLTGLLNRNTFMQRVDKLISESTTGVRHALLMLDVDSFKLVNDIFGHGAGDQVLIDIAELLSSNSQHNDIVGRLGGDEFVVFLPDISDGAAVAKKARRICEITRKTLSADVQISGSVGIALYPQDGQCFEALYKKADETLYYVKDNGKNDYAFYRREMSAGGKRRERAAVTGGLTASSGRKRRMLIVDDNIIDYELLANMFSDDYIIENAADGNTALVKLQHYGSAVSIVLLDLMMPGMSGFDVLEKMQQSESMRDIPVIVVSGADDQEASLKAIHAGASDFATKPVDPDILRIRVNSAVSKAENERLRAKNSFLEVQNEENIRYEAIRESTGITFIKYNFITDKFIYYPSVSQHLLGTYDDGRSLWQILLSDAVTDARTVQEMQQLVLRAAEDGADTGLSKIVKLKTPQNIIHRFRMNICNPGNSNQDASRIIIMLNDLDYEEFRSRRTTGEVQTMPGKEFINNDLAANRLILNGMEKRRMMIVDDNEINRDYLTSLFEDEFIIDTAAEGTSALIRLKRYGAEISIVLLDLMMPGVNGFDVLREMRKSLIMQAIPVIVVSGMDERETCLEAIREGASDYITKPVDAELLKVRVESALSRAENELLRAQNRFLAMQNEEAKRLVEARRHSEELSVALHAAERADIAKSQFLSSMSHEIRTPLNAVIGFNTIARNEMERLKSDVESRQANMKVLDCLTKSEIASRHLLTIINDVLDMSAIESGKMKVEKAPFDFKSLITSLTVMFFSQSRAKGVDFEVIFDRPTEEWFIGDQMRTNQILTNLLSNAVKFTREGGSVTLSITEKAIDDRVTGFCFVVSDTGIGMSQEYLEHIWTPFEQEKASTSRLFGGSGLGLSITKNLVDLMNGSITVESRPGEGSKFTVYLDFIRTKQPDRHVSYDFSSVNALVVDDDPGTCDYIKLLFDRCGAKCRTFTSSEKAIEAFASAKESGKPFNVCLVDWKMPEMDGFETIAEIRRISAKNLPIVVVTAYDFSEVSDQAEKLGINSFISKPLFQSSLFDLLVTISGKKSLAADARSQKYDFDGARVLLTEDNNMNMEVAKYMLRSAGIAVDCAWNGQEAIDIFTASRPGTYKAILMDVHMPEVDGYEATRLIRASGHKDAQKIPIIAMTADAFTEDIEEAHSAGMNAHIAKPIDTSSLFKLLESYMGEIKHE